MNHDDALLNYLAQFDTPTICNALELIDPSYRTNGFTTEPLQCIYPDLPSIVGYAKTGTVSAIAPSKKNAAEQLENRINWYKYVDQNF